MRAEGVRVVLVETSHPGNIGAAARAMKTMGLRRLYLVAPGVFPSAEATARASGADDLLAEARVCASLNEALAGCSLVIGASARLRSLQWPQLDPRECAARVAAETAQGEVALVFGRERSGLSNAELERCHFLVHIPTHPDYSSLNLAQAVQVLAYELRMTEAPPAAPEAEFPPATAEEMEGLYAHLEQTLYDLEFISPDRPGRMMRRLRRLLQRARPDRNELNILRGILSAAQAKARRE
ncbi:tRNA (cytosine(32)/uridine(32)-2'-O)-methyltransferase TrmJ [Thiohalobacter sp. IOR34]|uniref:tRNA (cytosine(32)/uridine(32)-2'-O)-methyltransferase TrmJ n=1 Tax=Thiohalobacter sp. IOR34 TaxID=3057176 RepID=UPI0025B23BF9|nr:tRNA (cytosine(32)/uridine(32)-2'-O)-methyltransferase TrmJ [Thiohalobacter sp. IOR34]WJW76253.1 tRNA (cytosine(32)/uridine(32)-2'-O)-methyltransferase TrmJ [Thiohalobacter sp. IOR34]